MRSGCIHAARGARLAAEPRRGGLHLQPRDGGANTPAKMQLQLDTTAASCTLGNEDNVGASGGLAADVVNLRGIFLSRR